MKLSARFGRVTVSALTGLGAVYVKESVAQPCRIPEQYVWEEGGGGFCIFDNNFAEVNSYVNLTIQHVL